MRISDWSSDVCSSDLHAVPIRRPESQTARHLQECGRCRQRAGSRSPLLDRCAAGSATAKRRDPCEYDLWRSEEHTSELQSLMRISYAVFCLKKKIKIVLT